MSRYSQLKKITLLALCSSLALSSILSFAHTSSLTFTADKSAKDFVKAVRERTIYNSYNQSPPPKEFEHDNYHTYGGHATNVFNDTEIAPIRIKTFSENVVVQEASPETLKTTLKVKKVSYAVLRFEHASKIILWVDGQQRVFDSDDYDHSLVEQTSVTTWRLKSNNSRSINSDYFAESLKKAVKLSLVPRENAYWSDYKGQKTKYKFAAKDYIFSFLATYYITEDYRHKAGGSKALDEYHFKETKSQIFEGGGRNVFPNEYLLQFMEIDYRAFEDLDSVTEHAPIEKVTVEGNPTEVFSVFLETGAKPNSQMELFFYKQLVGGTLLLPAPSEYIEEQSKLRADQSKDGEGNVKRIGYYWYSRTLEDQLYGGAYLLSSYEVIGGRATKTFLENPNYWDKEWVKNTNHPKQLVQEYYERDIKSYSQALYTNFAQGLTPYLGFSALDPAVISKITSGEDPNIPKELIKFSTVSNSIHIPWHFQAVSSPSPRMDENGRPAPQEYYFNDAFSRFMYGASLNILAQGRARTFHSFFGDDQISFRSLLIAGVNWTKAVFDTSSGQSIYNFTLAALDSRLEGKDQHSSKIQTTKDALELANTPFVVVEGKRAFDVPYSDNLRFAVESISQTEAYQGGGPKTFARIQEEMTKLLDRVYKKLSFPPETKLSFTLNWSNLSWSELELNAVNNVIKILNSLDKKGRLEIIFDRSATSNKDYYQKWRVGRSFTTPYGWSYDWEGNGSYLGAFLSHRFAFPLGFFPKLAQRLETDPNNPFPLLTRLAKLLKKGIERGEYRFSVPFEEWYDLTNFDSFRASEFISEGNIDADSEITKFLFRSEKEFTNEEVVRLNVELSVLNGPKWNARAHSTDPNSGARTLRHKGFYSPTRISGSGLWLQDEYFESVEKEE